MTGGPSTVCFASANPYHADLPGQVRECGNTLITRKLRAAANPARSQAQPAKTVSREPRPNHLLPSDLQSARSPPHGGAD